MHPTQHHQGEYYESLSKSDARGDSTVFIEFILKAIEETLERSQKITTDQVSDQVSDQVKKLLSVMNKEWLSSKEIMDQLTLSHRPTFRKNYLTPALKLGLIEMRDPESLRSPQQKYRVTEKRARSS